MACELGSKTNGVGVGVGVGVGIGVAVGEGVGVGVGVLGLEPSQPVKSPKEILANASAERTAEMSEKGDCMTGFLRNRNWENSNGF